MLNPMEVDAVIHKNGNVYELRFKYVNDKGVPSYITQNHSLTPTQVAEFKKWVKDFTGPQEISHPSSEQVEHVDNEI